jgi:hypothetical protein
LEELVSGAGGYIAEASVWSEFFDFIVEFGQLGEFSRPDSVAALLSFWSVVEDSVRLVIAA